MSDSEYLDVQPICSLPNYVSKTGEENEHTIFQHRSKLFKFSKGEWKERGLGDIKVLYNENTTKGRILMRREHIHKTCLNHSINNFMQLKV